MKKNKNVQNIQINNNLLFLFGLSIFFVIHNQLDERIM